MTPLWSPDGVTVVSRGWAGEGLFAARAQGVGAELRFEEATLVADYRGPAEWVDSGGGLCVSVADGAGEPVDALVDLSAVGGAGSIPQPNRCRLAEVVAGLGQLVHAGQGTKIYAHMFEGTITVEGADGQQRQLASGEALSRVAVSPDGRYVAISRGPLPEASLEVVGLDGQRLVLGHGAQPAWSSDGATLFYAVPSGATLVDGQAGFEHSELFAFSLEDGATVALTATDDVVEMEPAPSPDGALLAFADWRSGRTFAAPVEGRASR